MSLWLSSIRFAIFLLLVTGAWGSQAQEVPDMILVNGLVFTGAQARHYVDAIAIKGARILAVGTNQEISSIAGPKTRRIDVAGHLVIPGINDPHVSAGSCGA
jgi:predicted amidohydrolase YtcJ